TGPAPAAIPRPAPQPRHPERRARNDPDRRGHPPAKAPLTGIPNEAVGRLGAGFGYYTPLIRLSCPAHSRSRSLNFWTLPVEVFGSGPNLMGAGRFVGAWGVGAGRHDLFGSSSRGQVGTIMACFVPSLGYKRCGGGRSRVDEPRPVLAAGTAVGPADARRRNRRRHGRRADRPLR